MCLLIMFLVHLFPLEWQSKRIRNFLSSENCCINLPGLEYPWLKDSKISKNNRNQGGSPKVWNTY